MDNDNLVFLSYASPDRDRVFEYFDYLTAQGFQVWMDKHRIKGGQNWDYEIKRAMRRATVIVVFLSQSSVDRRGYAQREIKVALDQASDKLVNDIYLLPVMLDADVPIPTELEGIQVLRQEDGNAMESAVEAIELQFANLGEATARLQGDADIRWTLTVHKESWEGLPGYSTEFQLPRFQSDLYTHSSGITDVIRGWLVSQIMDERRVKYDQNSDFLNFGQDRFLRQNSWEAFCGDPKIKERVVSIAYSVWWNSAAAAHPNQGFKTFAFTLDPVTQINALEDIFQEPESAFPVIQAEVRKLLLATKFEGMIEGEEPLTLDQEWVENGTKEWSDLGSFVFGEDGIDILFGSYHVAAYAFGPQTVTVSYVHIAGLIKKEISCALGIHNFEYSMSDWTPADYAL